MASRMQASLDALKGLIVEKTDRALSDDEVEALVQRAEADEELDLIELVRSRLEIGEGEISDVSIAASLAQIAARKDMRGRWLAAFGSPLGKFLAMRGSDLNTTLNSLLGLAPRQVS